MRRAGPTSEVATFFRATVLSTDFLVVVLDAALVLLGFENNSRTPASVEVVPPKTIVRPSRPLHPAAASPVQSERRLLVGIRSVLRSVVWSFLSDRDVMRMVLPNRRR